MVANEDGIRGKLRAGDPRGAMALALAMYGPELYGFIRHVVPVEEDASDAYGATCEDLWRGFASFRWESTFRTWAYTIAHHACARQRRRGRRAGADTRISAHASRLAVAARSDTRPYVQTGVKQRFGALRAKLSEDERVLLTLRVDRELGWNDIARVMLGPDGAATERAVLGMAATCRKRFERAKERLRALAREEGLLRAEGA